jgi:uncharacterized iron-regulated membrane protein
MVRKVLHTLHLWLGLISGSLLVLVALTGCMLAFEDELRFLTQYDLLYVDVEEKPQLNVAQVLDVMKQHESGLKLNQIRYYGGADKAIQVYTRDKKIWAVNPYTGRVLGVRNMNTDPLYVILSFHRTLLLGKVGEEIILWNVCIFLAMLVSGLFIWLPPRIKMLRKNFSLKLSPPKKRNYDLHRMLGFYAWLPLFLIAITGISMAWGGEKGAKMQSTVHGPQSTAIAPSLYDRVLAEVYHGEPYDMLRVTFPADSTGVINIGIRYATSSFRKQSNFLFDQYSGALLKTQPYEEKSASETFFGSSYEIHTGRILGIPGKIVMFLAALVALSLPITGFLVWRGKQGKSTVHSPRSTVARIQV